MNVLVQGNTMPYATAFQAVRLPAACHLYMIAELFPVAAVCRSALYHYDASHLEMGGLPCKKK